VPKIGQTICYNGAGTEISCDGTGQDGEMRMGSLPVLTPSVSIAGAYTISEWMGNRFTDNGDGTVTDNVTGLIWLKDANCFGKPDWGTALSKANGLYDGCPDCGGTDNDCGLDDGSQAGDWRLPNVNDLHSVIDTSQSYPALPADHPFDNVQSALYYWSSTSHASNTMSAWHVFMSNGAVNYSNKSWCAFDYVWPVRGGQ
jgi:hypothetical protein